MFVDGCWFCLLVWYIVLFLVALWLRVVGFCLSVILVVWLYGLLLFVWCLVAVALQCCAVVCCALSASLVGYLMRCRFALASLGALLIGWVLGAAILWLILALRCNLGVGLL